MDARWLPRSPPSLPGLTRQSIFFAKCSCEADGPPNSGSPEFGFLSCASRINPTCVVKPAGDGREWVSAEPIRTGAALGLGIGRSILVHETAVGVGAHHVDVGADGNVVGRARADFEINRHRARFVDQVMAVAGAFRKGRAIT